MSRYGIKEAGRDPAMLLAEFILQRASNATRCWILVEGSDDKSVLQPYRGSDCYLKELDGRGRVLEWVRNAARWRGAGASQLDGYIGLVDRDFDHLATDRVLLPSRVKYASE